MTLFIAFLAFLTSWAIIYWMISPSDDALTVYRRLKDLRAGGGWNRTAGAKQVDAQDNATFKERVMLPLFTALCGAITRWAPRGYTESVLRRLSQAGNPMTQGRFVALKAALTAGPPMLILFSATLLGKAADLTRAVIPAVSAALIGYLLPDAYLTRLAKERRETIRAELPDVLDLLTVSVEAGLGFDGAVQKVAERFGGPVGYEFREFLKEVRLGKPRIDALRNLSARVPVDELRSFVASVIQAEQLGVSLAKVLRVQSEQMRLRRKQRAEEIAMQTPVKILFPLVFFIFPTIFMILLGPTAIQMLKFFRR